MNVMLKLSSQPTQIDVPSGVERSCKGAIHLRPGTLTSVTQAELDHIKKHRPDVFKDLLITVQPTVQIEIMNTKVSIPDVPLPHPAIEFEDAPAYVEEQPYKLKKKGKG